MTRKLDRLIAVLAALGVLIALAVAAPAAFAKDASADLDQCANGAITAMAICAGSQWQNGNLNGNQAHYFEGDSVPYRLKLQDLAPDTSYIVTIEWDTTKSGKHALDYLTSYDRTETTGPADVADFHLNQNDACSDYLGAGCLGAPSTLAIPTDPNVVGASGQHPSSQIAGNFTMWGANLSSTTAYQLTGTYAGDSSTSIDVTFHTPLAGNGTAVLAWGGHIATRADWGVGNSAIAISGSPYHMRLLNLLPPDRGGNQDRSLTADAVIYPASVTVTKDVVPDSSATFDFTSSDFTFPYPDLTSHSTGFTLGDGGSISSDKIVFFPATSSITENDPGSLYSTSVTCTHTPGIGGSGGSATPTTPTTTRTSNFSLNEGDIATCAYTNTFTPATPGVATTASAGGVISGSLKIHDTAQVGPGYRPTGTVEFRLYDNATCSGSPVVDETTLSSTIQNPNNLDTISVDSPELNATDLGPGTYHWVARYGGDANNGATSWPAANDAACNDPAEDVTIDPASPQVSTQVNDPDQRIGLGHSITDTATLSSDAVSPTGTMTFKVYGPTDAQEPSCIDEGPNANLVATFSDVAQSQDGSWTSPAFTPSAVGHYVFVASYSGDKNNNPDSGSCSDSTEQFDVVGVQVSVQKDANDTHAYDGDKVSFTISATNSGTDSLANVSVQDHIQGTTHTCETLSAATGDSNSNNELDPGETWKWICTVTVVHSEEIGGKIINLVHIEGDSVAGGDHVVSNEDDASVPIYHPAIALDKTGPATATAGDKVDYLLTVTNPGDEGFAEATMQVSDPQCNGSPVTLVGKNGDTTPGSFDPGDVWTYTCSVQTNVGDTAIHNVAFVTAKDQFATAVGATSGNGVVTASDPADTALAQPQQAVEPTRITPGSARLSGPTGCTAKAFNARVRGSQIATVTFVLDGKVVKTVKNPKSTAAIQLRINPTKLRVGVHRLVVTVTFQSSSQTKPKTMRLSFQRCTKKLVSPRFTG
jgi:large repetitive protein